jgi:hypothetical protein
LFVLETEQVYFCYGCNGKGGKVPIGKKNLQFSDTNLKHTQTPRNKKANPTRIV